MRTQKYPQASSVVFVVTMCSIIVAGLFPTCARAQEVPPANEATTSTSTIEVAIVESVASSSKGGVSGSLLGTLATPKEDLTKPEEQLQKTEIQILLERRPVRELSVFQFFAYWVQKAITLGIPANTIVLILLLPILATLVAFVRIIVGLPTLEMLVPIALAYAFIAVGVAVGLIILGAVLVASFLSRLILRRVRLMHFPKRSLSLLLLSLSVFFALSVGVELGLASIQELSIFPVLILTLLGDSIVSVQLHKSMSETLTITSITILLGLVGFILATIVPMRDVLILYPELVLLTIPLNLLMGRYFGLRLFELVRFRVLNSYGRQ